MDGSRHIVITGAGRGLGHAMVSSFVERGHVVIGCSRSQERVAMLRDQFPSPHHFEQVDVADEKSVAKWGKAMLSMFPAPDLLLNNAAIINRNSLLWETSPEEFSEVIDVNIKGVFHVIRHFVPAMVKRQSGLIVNFSSGWGRSTSEEVAPYCATKWAIEGLTQALAQELPRGMAAIPLNPGIIHTEMLESCFGANASAYPSPTQWAKKAVPFLLGLNASHNGRPLTVPG